MFYNTPFLFLDVVKNIKNKEFEFKNLAASFSFDEIKYIQKLINSGYKNKNNNIIKPAIKDNLQCSICYDNDEPEKNIDNYTKLMCGHIYHSKCIKEAIDTYFSELSSDFYKCPYCSTKFLHTEIL